MRHFLFTFLAFILALGQLAAQKTLPPSIQPYAVHWGYKVKQLLQEVGFEIPGPHAEFELRPQLESRSPGFRLDSTVSFYGYSPFGSPDSIPLFRNIYSYPSPDKEIIEESYLNNGIWIPLSQSTITKDNLNRITGAVALRYDEEAGLYIPDSRIRVYPHGASPELLDSICVEIWDLDLNHWRNHLAISNSFDDQDRLLESESVFGLFEFPVIFREKYLYNEAGLLEVIESYTADGEEEWLDGREEYTYEDGLATVVTALSSDGSGGFFPVRMTDNTYNERRLLEKQTMAEWDFEKEEWSLTVTDTYMYDDEERMVEHVNIIFAAPGLIDRTRYTYEYFRDEYRANETYYGWDSGWKIQDRKYYYYSSLVAYEPVDPVTADAMFLYPNPTSGIVHIKLAGSPTVYVYSLSGQLVRRVQMAPGEKVLNLTGLQAGVYQVRAKSNEDYYSGKLIIQ